MAPFLRTLSLSSFRRDGASTWLHKDRGGRWLFLVDRTRREAGSLDAPTSLEDPSTHSISDRERSLSGMRQTGATS